MLTVSTSKLELLDVWHESDPEHKRVQVAFPINKLEGSADSAVVYFTIAPGDSLGTHTDSAEEILYIVEGQAEATVGGERGILRAGDLAVVPAMAPHGLVNVGDGPVTVVGFFSEAEVNSTFEDTLQPLGAASPTMGAPMPA